MEQNPLVEIGLPIALFANLALGWQPVGADVSVSVPLGRTIGLLVGIVLVPVLLGMAIRRRAPQRAAALERSGSAFSGLILVVLIAVTVIGSEQMAVPSAVYGLLMYLSAAVLVVVGRRAAGMRVASPAAS